MIIFFVLDRNGYLGNGFYELQFPVSDRPLDVTVTAE